jgi:hypothetical protein
MVQLLSGATLRSGSANTFIKLADAQPQLPATPSTTTGFTVITRVVDPAELVTSYASSLGNIEFNNGTMRGNLTDLNIQILGTGTGTVIVSGNVVNTSTTTGVLVVKGGIGISDGLYTGQDISVNGLLIGQGYSNNIGGIDNLVIRGEAAATINNFPVGQRNIVLGYGTLQGIDTALKNIAIGRNALSTGSFIEHTIAIGDSALKNIGTTQTEFVGIINYVVAVNTLTFEVVNHGLKDGDQVVITESVGMTEINDQKYWIDILSPDWFAVYHDINLSIPVDGSTFNNYVSDGKVSRLLLWNGNFAIGTNAGRQLTNGEQNFFLGLNPAQNFTTGSYNFFMGHEIAQNMITGNSNISIGGDNMVDGLDNQVNIGSVFYYNGNGYLELNSNTFVGLGTESTSTVTGAFNVLGGVGITGNTYIGGRLVVEDTTPSVGTGTGALVVGGGASIDGDLYISGTLYATSLFAVVAGTSSASDLIKANATSATTYYLAMTDGVSGYTSIYSPLTITYDGFNDALSINSQVGFLNTTTSNSPTSGAATFAGGVGINENLNVAGLVNISNNTASTSTTDGALVVAGGVGVQGSIYSQDGQADENYLLYVPKTTVTGTGSPPTNARIGDFWIDTTILGIFQYINDGGNLIWIQTASI